MQINALWSSLPCAVLNRHFRWPTTKTLLIMKMTVLFLTVAFVNVSAKSTSQTVTFSEKDVSIEKVFDVIEHQTGYTFYYKVEVLQYAKKSDVDFNNTVLKDALTILFKNQPLSYYIVDKNIVVSKKIDISSIINLEMPPADIVGKVTDENGNPLAGANVKVKGSKKGVTTNADGSYTLKGVDNTATLEISYIGFETKTVLANNPIISLKRSESKLDEVQIVAYGTSLQRFQTGNVASIKAKDIEKSPINNPLLALQGRVPGLNITQGSGLPGGAIKVRVQDKTVLLMVTLLYTSLMVYLIHLPYRGKVWHL